MSRSARWPASESDRPVAVEDVDDRCGLNSRDINVSSHARIPDPKLFCHQVGCLSIAEDFGPSLIGREMRPGLVVPPDDRVVELVSKSDAIHGKPIWPLEGADTKVNA